MLDHEISPSNAVAHSKASKHRVHVELKRKDRQLLSEMLTQGEGIVASVAAAYFDPVPRSRYVKQRGLDVGQCQRIIAMVCRHCHRA